ncbi:MAG: gamma-glutamylcyclotransferase [Lentisphaeraceae bacterium]|nr:gamma-glutamylcyclotransferase [Lentisphaeraceae bacterium]
MYKVFVFGTLKEGFPNYKINKGSRLKGDFLTKKRYPLYLIGERFAPWLMLEQGSGHNVRGQVLTVNDVILAEMDKLERITELNGYRRIEITVISEESGEELLVFAYGKLAEQLSGVDIKLELDGEYKLEHSLLYLSRNP